LGQILARWPFWKAQKAKLKGNETPKGQNERMKSQKAKMKRNQAKRQILEKEKLQNLKGKWQFWARSLPGGHFGRLKGQNTRK